MAFEGAQLRLTGLTASADLSTKQFYLVKISGDKTVTVCAAVTDKPCGVLQNAPPLGQEAEVCSFGQTKISADAALVAGNQIGTSVDGQAAVYVPGTDTTKYIVGDVISGAGAAGELATVIIDCPGAGRGV